MFFSSLILTIAIDVVLRYSLAGQDTRLSPERPGFESRWRNAFSALRVGGQLDSARMLCPRSQADRAQATQHTPQHQATRRKLQATDGKRQAANTKPQTAGSRRQTTSSKHQTTSSRHQAASNKQQTTNNQQPATSAWPAAAWKQPVASRHQALKGKPGTLRLRALCGRHCSVARCQRARRPAKSSGASQVPVER